MQMRPVPPPDQGLREQVRDPRDCFSAFSVIREAFGFDRKPARLAAATTILSDV